MSESFEKLFIAGLVGGNLIGKNSLEIRMRNVGLILLICVGQEVSNQEKYIQRERAEIYNGMWE